MQTKRVKQRLPLCFYKRKVQCFLLLIQCSNFSSSETHFNKKFPIIMYRFVLYNFPPGWGFMSFGSVFHFDILWQDAFMKPSGEAFCFICTVCILSSILNPSGKHVMLKAITALTGIKTQIVVLFYLAPFHYLQAFYCNKTSEVENHHQPSKI